MRYLERLCEELAEEFESLTPEDVRQQLLNQIGSEYEAEGFARFMLEGKVSPVMTFLA